MDGSRIELAFPATMAGFRGAFGTLVAALDERSLPPGVRYGVELVFEEIVANILRHGTTDDTAAAPDVAVAVAIDVHEDTIVLTFDDDGPPFDPCGVADRPRARSLAEAEPGGLGLLLVRRAAQEIVYRRLPERRNRLIVTLAAQAVPAS